MRILNLTQHRATSDQTAQGVVDIDNLKVLSDLLTFEELPTTGEIRHRVTKIVDEFIIGEDYDAFMIGGAPFMMTEMEDQLAEHGKVLYAFSQRVSIDEALPNGSVVKRQVFKHLGFVEVE